MGEIGAASGNFFYSLKNPSSPRHVEVEWSALQGEIYQLARIYGAFVMENHLAPCMPAA
jgi:hypothetical protein